MGNYKATLSTVSRWRKFVGDMGVYAVGNLGAKVLTFLMVPLYTYFIPDTSEFGYFDICLTATFLLTPLVTLGLRDGVFRFLLDAPDDAARRRVVSTSFRLLARSLALWLAVLLLAAGVLPLSHTWLVLLLLLSVVANEVYGQLVRGLGLNRFFAGMGLATAVLIVVLSVALVGWLGYCRHFHRQCSGAIASCAGSGIVASAGLSAGDGKHRLATDSPRTASLHLAPHSDGGHLVGVVVR